MLGGLRCSHIRPNTSPMLCSRHNVADPNTGESNTSSQAAPHCLSPDPEGWGVSDSSTVQEYSVSEFPKHFHNTSSLIFNPCETCRSDSVHIDSNAGVLDQMLLLPLSPDPRKGCCMPQGTPPPPRQKGESHQTPSRRHKPRSFLEFLTNFILHSYHSNS